MISRWDISSLVNLPEYMKLCYKALLNIFEETEQELRKQGKEYFVKYSKNEVCLSVFYYLSNSFECIIVLLFICCLKNEYFIM